jgi:release factor glutamine methyltransferase
VEAALEGFADGGRVLDLGTGTGALLLAVLAERPAAWGLGIDRMAGAARLAARNAAANGLAGRAAFLAGDWDSAIAGRFDLVLSNPPYIATAEIPDLMTEVARHEPALALDGGADGLDAYRHIVGRLGDLLAPGGRAVLELGAGQRAAVESLAAAAGLAAVSAARDLGGIDRALVLRSPAPGGPG